jgi:hypothetical protein
MAKVSEGNGACQIKSSPKMTERSKMMFPEWMKGGHDGLACEIVTCTCVENSVENSEGIYNFYKSSCLD